MSTAKRKDGRYVVKFKDITGKWKQRTFRTKEEARRFDAETDFDSVETQRLTLMESVLLYLKNTQHANRTVTQYERIMCGSKDRYTGRHRAGCAEHLANKFADSLTRLDLESVRERCRKAGNTPHTSNIYVSRIKAALNWCAEQELIHKNPWSKFRNLPSKSASRMGTLEDLEALYPYLPSWLQWATQTCLALCLRPGIAELFSLEWKSFDWRLGAVRVNMPKVDKVKLVFPPDAYMQIAKSRYAEDTKNGYSLVCRTDQNKKVTSNKYTYAWNKACKAVGVSMPMYALRHITASEMLAGGADLASVAAQLGHKSITTTAGYYLHAIANAQKHAATAIPTFTNSVSNLVQLGAKIDKQSK